MRPTEQSSSSAKASVSVSVVMPIKAPAPWIGVALDSILAQTHPATEAICVVDGHDREMLGLLKARDNVEVLVNEVSRGPAYARNRGINSASSNYIALLDSDDEWAPTHLEQLTSALRDDPNLLVVGSRAITMNERGRILGSVGGRARASRSQLLIRNQFVNSGTVFRQDAALNVGGLNTEVRVCEDYDLWLRLAAKGPVRMVGGPPTVKYRVTTSGVSREHIDQRSREAVRVSRRQLGRSLNLPQVVPDTCQWAWERYLDLRAPSAGSKTRKWVLR